MLTLISPPHLKVIIQLSGHAIRSFLSQAHADDFKGEAREAIKVYQANPNDFSDDKLVIYGADVIGAINYPLRIEVRGVTNEGCAQMVAKGIWGPKRAQAAEDITKQCRQLGIGLHLKLAGSSSIEFNVDGVDKALPIKFLQRSIDKVLNEMDYRPGSHIDSRKTRTVIAADGDSTIYDGPRVGCLPSLAESPVKDVLIAYLQAGGVFMLVSGNNLERSYRRLVDSLPKETYCRVLVAANGGAEMVYVDTNGQAVPVSGYRQQALKVAQEESHRQSMDMVYIGDDGSRDGNDYPAFKAIGFERSVLVAAEFLKDFDPALKPSYIGGLLQGTRKYIESFLTIHMASHKVNNGA